MAREEDIQKELEEKFPYLKEKVKVKRARRVFAEVPADKFGEVLEHAVKSQGFMFLSAITGVDDGDNLGFIYHLVGKGGMMLNLKLSVPKAKPAIKTVTKYFPAADIYERELKDMFGAEVEGLPAGRRYPLPDDWPAGQYPLRKEWKQAGKEDAASEAAEVEK
jgi:membrane-bound hydrogenase subunit beta